MSYPILYEDDDWLVVDKPVDITTHSVRPGDTGLTEWLALHLGRHLHVCSRLDKGTSGVLLFAKHSGASGRAQVIHEQREALKTYRFISTESHRDSEIWRVKEPLGGQECSTCFRLIAEGHGYFCYEATIHRGRTHQIRQHAALAGVPIHGDRQYGQSAFSRLCLHCCELSWPDIEASVASRQPDSFSMLLGGEPDTIVGGAVAWERRLGWPGLVSNSFRLVQRGEVALPVSIDLYDSVLSITVFSEEYSNLHLKKELHPLLEYLRTKVNWQGGVLRRHVRNPHQNRLIHDALSWGNIPATPVMAWEHDLSYTIIVNDSQHTGLFLDQRDSRMRIHQVSRSRRVANLFSFTCSFSAAALAGGAEVVFSVDLAGSSLKRGMDNFSLNGLDLEGRGKFVREDVMKWLARQGRKKLSEPDTFDYWDLIICDPPVFGSGGGGRSFQVEKQWPELVRKVRFLLSGKGIALFANNHRSGRGSFYREELQKHFKTVTTYTPPLDFPVLAGEPEHVRIYWCEV